ncbi:MAG: CHAT domain-containing protein [Thioploca sp.]|nr:CHAT domain-containing protein [Thioploca sp.]
MKSMIMQVFQHWIVLLFLFGNGVLFPSQSMAKTQNELIQPDQYVNTLIRTATTYQADGHYPAALTTLQQAQVWVDQHGNAEQQVLVSSYLGDILLVLQQPEEAETYLEKQLVTARTLGKPIVLMHLLNNLGNAFLVQEKYAKALTLYQEVIEIAKNQDDIAQQIQTADNLILTHLELGEVVAGFITLENTLSLVHQQADGYFKTTELLRLGELALQIYAVQPQPATLAHAYQAANEAWQLAQSDQDKRLMSYAKSLLARVYELRQRYPEALQLIREAIFLAQPTSDLLYQWEWQQGQLLESQHDLVGAAAAYQSAFKYLQPVVGELTTGLRNAHETFQKRIRPIYYDLADVLLQQSAIAAESNKPALLKQAREVVEQLKAAELQDYFQDDCVVAVQEKVTALDQVDPHTAVLYPILLPDRTELLLSLPTGIYQVVVPVTFEQLEQTVRDFRENLQVSASNRYFVQAKQLYQWLIAPVQVNLKEINTLVIVPDGPLRTIPFAAFYDNQAKQFLVEQLALATTPGIRLTDPRPLPRQNESILLNGLSESVQNFPALPYVKEEVDDIGAFFQDKQVLINQAFSLKGVSQALRATPYLIVHIASHGQFDRNPKNTFLLAYDTKINMDRLENLLSFSQFRENPVELLTLSACKTVEGDERSALGLAGVAIKAGARSALASLWAVNDESTSQLISEFYRQISHSQVSKAQALQSAQQKLLEQKTFRHPVYWAPFLLIGNWL